MKKCEILRLNYGIPTMFLSLIRREICAIFIVMLCILFGSGYCFPQSKLAGQIMNSTVDTTQIKNVAPVYLDKNDPIFITIKGRVITDLKKRSDPESTKNKLIAAQMKTLTEEKQNQLETLFKKSITDYITQAHFDVGILMRHFNDLERKDLKKIAEEYDIRVQYVGCNKYVAEFWEDGLAVNSEAHALASTNNPDDRISVKETYADVRKSIEAGKQERYTKVMALLYTLDKDGSSTFHDPFQSVIDFIKE